MRVDIDNLGIPPLAGICSYEEACKPGYSIDFNVSLLKRFYYMKTQLNLIYAAHLAHTPEWEVKCAISLHMWLEAEHAAALRKRVSEMREPPLHLDKVPDPKLESFMQELIRSTTTDELISGIYKIVKPEMIRSLKKHLQETNPLTDYPTRRLLLSILDEEEQMLAWGEQAVKALTQQGQASADLKEWQEHLQSLLQDAGGIFGDLIHSAHNSPTTNRWNGDPYEMDATPQRDPRFVDPFNRSAEFDVYYKAESLEYDERTYALLYKRLREMDVPEWMGPIIYKTTGKPLDYYVDLSRQLWDEARHAMMGEVGLYAHGVPFYKYPIDINSSVALNAAFKPLEANLILWAIEQGLMNKKTGKGWEYEIAQKSDHELAALFQDYDWADEVLHTQIGRKWLLPEYGSLENMKAAAEPLWKVWGEATKENLPLSNHDEWWSSFIQDIRKQRELLGK
jgi:bacterioferritin (cytochrome b1)